jgi:pilus assembly protein CpaE
VLFGGAANSGRMISEIDKRSPTAETISQISHIITGRASHKKTSRSGLAMMLDLLGRNK